MLPWPTPVLSARVQLLLQRISFYLAPLSLLIPSPHSCLSASEARVVSLFCLDLMASQLPIGTEVITNIVYNPKLSLRPHRNSLNSVDSSHINHALP